MTSTAPSGPRRPPPGRLHPLRPLGPLVVAVALLASCGGGGAGRPDPVVGFVVANQQLNYAQEMSAGYRAGGASGGVEVVVAGPTIVDFHLQLEMFEEMTETHPDGLSVFTLAPELFADAYRAARAEGVPVIAVDNPPPSGSGVELFISHDNVELGETLADLAVEALPADADGLVVLGTSSPGVPVLDQRAEAMRLRLAESLPGVSVVGPFDTKQDVSANRRAWETLVSSYPDALAFLGTGDADAWNLAAIRQETGASWLAGGFDLDPRSLDAVKDGDLLLVSPEHFLKGALAGRLNAERARLGRELPAGWLYTPGLAITADNVDEIIDRQASDEARTAWFAEQIDDIVDAPEGYLRPIPLT